MKIVFDPYGGMAAYDDDDREVDPPDWAIHQHATGHALTFTREDPPVCADCPWPNYPEPRLCPTCHGRGVVR